MFVVSCGIYDNDAKSGMPKFASNKGVFSKRFLAEEFIQEQIKPDIKYKWFKVEADNLWTSRHEYYLIEEFCVNENICATSK
jgi:hypothetical protein